MRAWEKDRFVMEWRTFSPLQQLIVESKIVGYCLVLRRIKKLASHNLHNPIQVDFSGFILNSFSTRNKS